jgi:hypothetical protein
MTIIICSVRGVQRSKGCLDGGENAIKFENVQNANELHLAYLVYAFLLFPSPFEVNFHSSSKLESIEKSLSWCFFPNTV